MSKRRTRDEIDREWYQAFARWNKQDRAAALRSLAVLHDNLPDAPRGRDGQPADEPTTLDLKETASGQ